MAAEGLLPYMGSPSVRGRVFGLSGQVLHIFITVMCDFAYGFPHGYMPYLIELPLGTIPSHALAGRMTVV